MFLPQSTGFKCSLALVFSFLILSLPLNALAEKAVTEQWQITADKITRYDHPQSIIAIGNIVLIKRQKLPPRTTRKKPSGTDWSVLLGEKTSIAPITPQELAQQKPRFETKITIKADWMAYDVTRGTIKARGHVDVISGGDRVLAEEGKVNLSRETGTFKNATILREKNQLHLEGKIIRKTGYQTYRITDGWVITCKLAHGEAPPWSLSSKETTLTPGGYAVLKDAKFNIKGVPVLYTPYMMVPVKNTRQTGFLFPELSSSSNSGYGIDIPFFYNISDSADMTFYPEFYSKRGFMPGAEFRYVLDSNDKGTFAVNFLHDRISDPSDPSNAEYYSSTGFTHSNEDRYWIRGKLDKTFGDGWTSRVDLDIVSDQDYLTEFYNGYYSGFVRQNQEYLRIFGRGFQDQTQAQRRNSVSLLKSWSGMSLITNLVAIDDAATVKSDPSPLWKLPAVDFTGATTIDDSNFTFNWDANYVDYWRKNGVGAQRFDLYPKLSTPLPFGPYLESRAEVGVRETFYDIQTHGDGTWSKSKTQNRTLYSLHTELGTTLARDFAVDIQQYKGIEHKVRPYIDFDYIPDVNQSDLPSFDGIDYIAPADTFTYGVDNFFSLFKNPKDPEDSSKTYGYLKIKQQYYLGDVRKKIHYDFNNNPLPPDEIDKPFSPIDFKLGIRPLHNLNITYQTDLDVYTRELILHSFGGSYKNSRGDIYDVDYQYSKLQHIEQINLHIKSKLFYNLRGEIRLSQSLSTSTTNQEDVALTYVAPCWSVELLSTHTPTDTAFYLIFNLANISSPMGVSL